MKIYSFDLDGTTSGVVVWRHNNRYGYLLLADGRWHYTRMHVSAGSGQRTVSGVIPSIEYVHTTTATYASLEDAMMDIVKDDDYNVHEITTMVKDLYRRARKNSYGWDRKCSLSV